MAFEMNRQYYSQRSLITPSYRVYPAKITIQHWQLRDLVCVSTKFNNEVLYPRDNNIFALNLSTGLTHKVTTFNFSPGCIQTSRNLIAVGALQQLGQSSHTNPDYHGLFAVHNRQTGTKLSKAIGGCINSSICLYSEAENSQYKAIISNNDMYLYIVDINNSDIQISTKISFSASLNHASISPDRKTIVACGDFRQLYVCHPEEPCRSSLTAVNTTKNNWKVSDELNVSSSYGFSTSFHESGVIFGGAFQDGIANLYDMRNLSHPLTRIYSTRPNNYLGAFRSLKFSQGLHDMVVVSENESRVHVIDVRNFSNHQVLTIPEKLTFFNPQSYTATFAANSEGREDISQQSWSTGYDSRLIQQYDEMIMSGDALKYVPKTEDSASEGITLLDTQLSVNSSVSSSLAAIRSLTSSYDYFHPRFNSDMGLSSSHLDLVTTPPNESLFAVEEAGNNGEKQEKEDRNIYSSTVPLERYNSREFQVSSEYTRTAPQRRNNTLLSPNTTTHSDYSHLADPFCNENSVSVFSRPLRYQGLGFLNENSRNSRRQERSSLINGELFQMNHATLRRALMLEQQLSNEYAFNGNHNTREFEVRNFSNGSTASETDNVLTSDGERDEFNNSDNDREGDRYQIEHSRLLVDDEVTDARRSVVSSTVDRSPDSTYPILHNSLSTSSSNREMELRPDDIVAAWRARNNDLSSSANVISHDDLSIQTSSTVPAFSTDSFPDEALSGIAWSDFQGGSLVVGSCMGIGVWAIDQLDSITFPNYEQR